MLKTFNFPRIIRLHRVSNFDCFDLCFRPTISNSDIRLKFEIISINSVDISSLIFDLAYLYLRLFTPIYQHKAQFSLALLTSDHLLCDFMVLHHWLRFLFIFHLRRLIDLLWADPHRL